MSSGEGDGFRCSVTLDHFRVCDVPGCIWSVQEPARRCFQHGGPPVAQFASGANGEILDTRHMPEITD